MTTWEKCCKIGENIAKKLNNLTGKEWLKYSISVWNDIHKTAEEKRLDHPAVFPVELAKRLIQIFTNDERDCILDPFVGSGSTLVAADLCGKVGYGFDISEKYVEMSKS